MSSSDRSQLPLTVRAEDAATEIWILDGRFRTVAYGLGQLQKRVLPGIYKVRAEAGSASQEQVVVLETEGREVFIPALQFSSPAPLPRTAQSHEYHEQAVEDESCRVHVEAGSGSALFVFVRRWTEPDTPNTVPRSLRHPAVGLSLHHVDGRPVAELPLQSASYSSPLRDAWAACTVLVDPGPYRLRLVLPDGLIQEQVLIAAPGWMTQVFALLRRYGPEPDDERADLPGATIVYRRIDDVDVKNRYLWLRPQNDQEGRTSLRLSELARQGLMDRRNVLPRDVTDMLWEKWGNPMLGLYGAHLLLLDPEPSWSLFRKVINNLRRILGPHPDVEALALQREETADWSYRFEIPPMLRRSWTLVQQATFARSELVPAGSLASQVSDRLWGGSLWHLWRGPAVADLNVLAAEELQVTDQALAALSVEGGLESMPAGPPPPTMDGYDVAIATQLRLMEEPGAPVFWEQGLEGRILYDLAQERPELGEDAMQRLMETVGLPRAKVQERVDSLYDKAQIYESIRSEMPPSPERTWQLESVVHDVRQAARKGDVAPDVSRLIDEGSDGSRITALGILQARPDAAFFPFVKSAIAASRSAFEQFHALLAAQVMLPKLDSEQKLALYKALQDQRSGGEGKYIRPGTDRWVVSSRILATLEQDESWMVRDFRPLQGPA